MALFYPHYSSYLDFLCCSFSGSGPRDSRSIAAKAADSEPWASWSRMSRMRLHNIAGWWWPTPLKNMKVRWDHYSQYMENKNCSKPPTSEPLMNIYIFIYVFIYWFIHLFIYLFIYCFYLFNYLLICLFIYLLLVIIVNSQAIDEYEHVNIIPIWMRRFRNFHVLSTIFQDFRMTIFFLFGWLSSD